MFFQRIPTVFILNVLVNISTYGRHYPGRLHIFGESNSVVLHFQAVKLLKIYLSIKSAFIVILNASNSHVAIDIIFEIWEFSFAYK